MAEGGGEVSFPQGFIKAKQQQIPNSPGEAPRPGELAKWVGEKTTQVLSVLRQQPGRALPGLS